MPTLELTDNEARLFVTALELVCDCLDHLAPDEIRNEYEYTKNGLVHLEPSGESLLDRVGLTNDEVEALRSKLQTTEDVFRRQTGQSLDPIKWPPTEQDLLTYLSESLKQQLPGTPEP